MITLDAKTDFSFMRGFGKPAQWLERAAEIECPALGIADFCSTWGHAEFQMANKTNVKLLYGVQLPVVVALTKDSAHDLVTLIARSSDGLSRLYGAVGIAEAQGYYRPRLTWEQVADLTKHCFVIVNECSIGSLNSLRKVKGIIVAGRPVDDRMHTLIRDGGFPCVPAYSPRFPRVEDRKAFELLQAISAGHRVGEHQSQSALPLLRRVDYEGAMRACGIEPAGAWFDLAARIVDECSANISKAQTFKYPSGPKKGYGGDWELGKWCAQGAQRLGIDIKNGPYADRFVREFEVIREKNFFDYFLFVADLVAWAKKRMFVGPGRGSSGGSLLCYLLGITTVDPLKYGTLFERFIDITRPDWPDIDVDFPDDKRDLVFAYLKEKYGDDHVARLGTVSEFGAKGAVNDTAKATGVSYDVAREMGKLIEGHVIAGQLRGGSLTDLFASDEALRKYIDANPSLALAGHIFEHARHHGVHAAGVVVTKQPVTTFGAVDKHGTIALDMKMAEKIGLIKMDALGLRTLSVIQACCDAVNIDPASLYDLDPLVGDDKVWALFNADRVTGIFQFEGHTVRQLTKSVKVDRFDDLCAITSLARPGPLMGGAAGTWCKRRSGEEDWDYKHPSLEKHTKNTLGVWCYQEQVMSLARDIAGFDEPAVNALRRAIGKKSPETLQKFREQFLQGCRTWHERTRASAAIVVKGREALAIPDETAADLWNEICEFGSYAFNFSHAVAYSMISYMSAHLKAHYPLEFAVAQLRNAADEDQAKQLLRELTEEGYAYIAFDPRHSLASWSIQDGKLYGGFDSVKGVGPKTAAALLEAREQGGEDWMDALTDSQRDRLLGADNTPWHSLSYFGRKFARLYEDPEGFRTSATPAGVTAPVYRIKDIPAHKGTYRFLGRIARKWSKTKDDKTHWNLIFADDTGEIGGTINRFKVSKFEWLIDSNCDDRDFLIKADIIEDGRQWTFIDQIVELTDAVAAEDQAQAGTGKGPRGDSGSSTGDPAVRADDKPAGRKPAKGNRSGRKKRVDATRRRARS